MAINASALGSLSLSLQEMVERIGQLANDVGDDDDIGGELREVQRQLHTASRRLDKAVRRL